MTDSKAKPKATRGARGGKSQKPTAKAAKSAKTTTKAKPAKPGAGKPRIAKASELPPALQIDRRIRELGGWRGQTLARMRALILQADPEMTEEWKWNTPVWSHGGIICTGEAYKSVVKLTFAHGASLPDPAGLFNSSLEGNTRRAIDIQEGGQIDARAFQALVKAAVSQNCQPAKKAKPAASEAKPAGSKTGQLKLLSGGNPQIAKAYGDAPVQAYIAAMPGWKSDVGRRLDALITRAVPKVYKAVKWNSPLYGIENEGWFLGIHCFAKYIKVAFFRGASLRPLPPGTSKQKEVRYLDIREGDQLDEAQFSAWVKQASNLPGEKM